MMFAIFKYLDRIMFMVRPRRLVYMAIDGVAPRAKMNQQRSRRFRAAREAKEKAESKEENDDNTEDINEEISNSVFDSNVITPGTPFMQLVSDSIKYYIHHRLSTQPGWSNLKVILSDWTVPGEGEHKIVDFIRRQRLDPEYDANQENVIYGLDADLIMLTMATHEARFRVLREDVFWEEEKSRGLCRHCQQPGHFAGDCPNPASTATTEEGDPHMTKPFIFLNVATLREYLEVEMRPDSDQFPFDPERAIDDWVFLCFFVGNDFLPHLPSLELREGAIDTLLDIYRQWADEFAGPLTKDGKVNFERVYVILQQLAGQEEDILRRRKEREDRREENMNARKRRQQGEEQNKAKKKKLNEESECPTMVEQANDLFAQLQEIKAVNAGPADSKAAIDLKQRVNQVFSVSPSTPSTSGVESVIDEVRFHEPGARIRYYIAKFGKDPREHPDLVRSVCKSYLEGMAWVMGYYYQGCPSWKWYYPYHYAPFAADFIEYLSEQEEDSFWRQDIKFELGKPFRPFDQLMSVFPAASAQHIPPPFRRLMTDHDSDLLDYYPEDFLIDLNGKKHAWQGVALLPFIDEDRLLASLEQVYPELDEAHCKLNQRGHDLVFVSEKSTLFGFLCTIDSDPQGIWPLDTLLSKGLAGSVRFHSDGHPLDVELKSPFDTTTTTNVINHVVSALYYPVGVSNQESSLRVHFSARLLPKARLPASILTSEERARIRSGQYASHGNNYNPYSNASSYNSRRQEYGGASGNSYFRAPNPDYGRR